MQNSSRAKGIYYKYRILQLEAHSSQALILFPEFCKRIIFILNLPFHKWLFCYSLTTELVEAVQK